MENSMKTMIKENVLYREAVEYLPYLTHVTQPDIIYALNNMSCDISWELTTLNYVMLRLTQRK